MKFSVSLAHKCLILTAIIFLRLPNPTGRCAEGPLETSAVGGVAHPYTNRLVKEKSPYLLQHAHNPVDWYSWGEEAFARAQKENKPIFLSVGYSTCHWCHVMEHESFENLEIATVLNEAFVCIKVDREERPDVDRVYMTFVQATTGGGGWPMSVWLTPDLKPFLGGTYYPPENFAEILKKITKVWKTDREKVLEQGDQLSGALQKSLTAQQARTNALQKTMLQNAFAEIDAGFDSKEGGEAGAPKFPRPVTMNFLFRLMAREGKESKPGQRSLEMNLLTLRKMAAGGIHDHLGGGFHRYAVDAFWHVPHFEKMLYDQAQLAISYLEAFQITHEPIYEQVARDICDYVRRDMADAQGGFYCAEDADSLFRHDKPEHGEGAFYIWKKEEIDRVLGNAAAEVFNSYYGVEPKGNVQENNDPRGELRSYNVLIQRHTLEETAKKLKLKAGDVQAILGQSRQKLFEARARRPRPHRDDKIITAWNGLMISAFAKAYQTLAEPVYLESATRAAGFIHEQLQDSKTGELIRSYRQGASTIRGFADDYAFLIQGLLDLYEASFDIPWLQWATELQAKQDHLFWDERAGAYYSASARDERILLHLKDDYDGAEPSPNSIAALNLLRIAQIRDDPKLRQQSAKIFALFSSKLKGTPRALPQMLVALQFYFDNPKQIVLAGQRDSPGLLAMLKVVHSQFIPNKILLLADGGPSQNWLAERLEFIKGAKMLREKTTAYICENYVCKLPTSDLGKVAELLGH